jgi:hypothetical protein
MPLPFDLYPHKGRQLIERSWRGSNARHDYGLVFMKVTGQTRCAYCEVSLIGSYEAWLSLVLDHVVPSSVCIAAKVPDEWCGNFSNAVLACAACNGFCNRYKPSDATLTSGTLEAFYDLRDRIFVERKKLITRRRAEERQFFEKRHWESP